VATYENRRIFKPFWGHTTKLTLPKNSPHLSTWVDKFLKISRKFLIISRKFLNISRKKLQNFFKNFQKKVPEKVATYGGFGDLWKEVV